MRKVLENTFPGTAFNQTCKRHPSHANVNSTLASDEWKPKNYWEDTQNCRKFFEEYAKQNNFNPLNADDWYSISLNALRKKKNVPCPFPSATPPKMLCSTLTYYLDRVQRHLNPEEVGCAKQLWRAFLKFSLPNGSQTQLLNRQDRKEGCFFNLQVLLFIYSTRLSLYLFSCSS